MIRKAIIVVLSLAATTTGVAWSGTHIFPLAVLQVLGLADSGSLHGVRWDAEWNVWEGKMATHVLNIRIRQDSIYFGSQTYYVQSQSRTGRQYGDFGPVKYSYSRSGMTRRHRSRDGQMGVYQAARFMHVRLPLLPLCILLAVYPMIALIRPRLRLRRRRRKGQCLKCGYDLMGNVSGVCPECGVRVCRTRG